MSTASSGYALRSSSVRRLLNLWSSTLASGIDSACDVAVLRLPFVSPSFPLLFSVFCGTGAASAPFIIAVSTALDRIEATILCCSRGSVTKWESSPSMSKRWSEACSGMLLITASAAAPPSRSAKASFSRSDEAAAAAATAACTSSCDLVFAASSALSNTPLAAAAAAWN